MEICEYYLQSVQQYLATIQALVIKHLWHYNTILKFGNL
jgi:hypothetical protein